MESIVKYEVLELANYYSSDVSGIGKAIVMDTDKIHEEPLAEQSVAVRVSIEETVAENVVMTTEVVIENVIEVEAVEESTSIKDKIVGFSQKSDELKTNGVDSTNISVTVNNENNKCIHSHKLHDIKGKPEILDGLLPESDLSTQSQEEELLRAPLSSGQIVTSGSANFSHSESHNELALCCR